MSEMMIATKRLTITKLKFANENIFLFVSGFFNILIYLLPIITENLNIPTYLPIIARNATNTMLKYNVEELYPSILSLNSYSPRTMINV